MIIYQTQHYKELLEAGIKDDYSLGYTNINGFRASFCYPYKWYSLEDEAVTTLRIHPFCFTGNTALYYESKKDLDMLAQAKLLIDEVKKYNGELISIFHNEAFDEQMKVKYEEFIQLAIALPVNQQIKA